MSRPLGFQHLSTQHLVPEPSRRIFVKHPGARTDHLGPPGSSPNRKRNLGRPHIQRKLSRRDWCLWTVHRFRTHVLDCRRMPSHLSIGLHVLARGTPLTEPERHEWHISTTRVHNTLVCRLPQRSALHLRDAEHQVDLSPRRNRTSASEA
jgi:hypothetical protein